MRWWFGTKVHIVQFDNTCPRNRRSGGLSFGCLRIQSPNSFIALRFIVGSIYATGTVRPNRIGLPLHLRNTKAWKKCEQGHIEWAMHDSRLMGCVMWKDKCPVLLISTHAYPIGFPCVPRDEVPRWNGAVREKIPTSPMLLEYTTFMRGVDVKCSLRILAIGVPVAWKCPKPTYLPSTSPCQ
jgi:hypothetical protein